MAEEKNIKVEDLPKPEKELTPEEAQEIKGGLKAEMYCERANLADDAAQEEAEMPALDAAGNDPAGVNIQRQ